MTKAHVHRSNKEERAEALRVLKAIWEKGYYEGITLSYATGEEAECAKVFYSLGDYRKLIQKKRLVEYEMFLKVQATMLQRIDDLTIKLTRKPVKATKTSEAILNTVVKFPELGLSKKEYDDPVHELAASVTKSGYI